MKTLLKRHALLAAVLYLAGTVLMSLPLAPAVLADNGYIDPNADGSVGSWNTTGVSRYTEIDEAIRQPSIPTVADYIYSSSPNSGNYFARASTLSGVYRVSQIVVWVYHNDGSNRQLYVQPFNDNESTSYAGEATVTRRSANTWDSVTFSGLNLTQAQLDALSIKLRASKSGGGGTATIYVYEVYAIITYSTPPTFEQSAYRFYANQNSTDVGSPLSALNTNAVLTASGQAFRLRALIHVGTSDIALNDETFKLQYVGRGAGSCDTPSGGTPSSYSDVTTSTLISYYNNATPIDSADLTANANDPTHLGHLINDQTYEEANNFVNSRAAIPAGNDGKWDFALYDNGAPAATTYCLRIVKSDGTLLNTYSVYPQITTSGGTLGIDIVDAGGAPVGAPAYAMSVAAIGFACQTTTTTIGTTAQKLRLTNNTTNVAWSLTIAATGGVTGSWSSGSANYDFNDPSGTPAGCADGGDISDDYAGQLSLDPSVAALVARTGCTNSGVSLGSASAFDQGTVDSITLASASSSAFTACHWDLTDISASQTIPPEQAAGSYSINLTVTATAV